MRPGRGPLSACRKRAGRAAGQVWLFTEAACQEGGWGSGAGWTSQGHWSHAGHMIGIEVGREEGAKGRVNVESWI